MAKRDYYVVLGLGKNASDADIKAAYRKAVLKYHPDVNKSPDAAEKFKETTEAYEVLSDPQKRKMYDQFGHAAPGFTGAGPGRGGPGRGGTYRWTTGGPAEGFNVEDLFGGGGGFTSMDLEDILNSLRGGGFATGRQGGRAEKRRGADSEYSMQLDFMQAVRGTMAAISIRRQQPSGAEKTETINVKIPAGVKDGTKIRVRGKGQEGPAGSGDLYIVTEVRPHPYFTREDDDIYVELPISVSEAALGAKVDVPTIDGMTTMTIPAGTTGGQKLRLRGKGVPSAGGRGDQYVVIKIAVPKKISPRGQELLKEFQAAEKFDPRQNAPWK